MNGKLKAFQDRANSGYSGQHGELSQNKMMKWSAAAAQQQSSVQQARGPGFTQAEGQDDGGTPQRLKPRRTLGSLSLPGSWVMERLSPSLPWTSPFCWGDWPGEEPGVTQTWSEAGWARNTLVWVTSPPEALSYSSERQEEKTHQSFSR